VRAGATPRLFHSLDSRLQFLQLACDRGQYIRQRITDVLGIGNHHPLLLAQKVTVHPDENGWELLRRTDVAGFCQQNYSVQRTISPSRSQKIVGNSKRPWIHGIHKLLQSCVPAWRHLVDFLDTSALFLVQILSSINKLVVR
jgi:hypothetical protein